MSLRTTLAASDNINHGSASMLDNIDTATYYVLTRQNALTADRQIIGKTAFATGDGPSLVTRAADASAPRGVINRATASMTLNANTGTLVAGEWAHLFLLYSIAGSSASIWKGNLWSPVVNAGGSVTVGSGALKNDASEVVTVGNSAGQSLALNANYYAAGMWNRNLTQAEMLMIQQLVRPRGDASPSLYNFDGFPARGCLMFSLYGFAGVGLGQQLDLTGNNNHGVVTGAVLADDPPLYAPIVKRSKLFGWRIPQAITGTLAKTLGAATLSATGSTLAGRVGALAKTLGSLTSTSAGKVLVKGTTAKTLGALTVTGRATAPNIVVDTSTSLQTMLGWEMAGVGDTTDTNYATYKSALFDDAVNDLGLTRIRAEVGKVVGSDAFDLTALDALINAGVTAIRTKVLAAGKTFWLNICVVGGGFSKNTYGSTANAAAFASAMLALYQHMQSTFGYVPDSFEILEPDTFGWYTGLGSAATDGSIGDCYAKAGDSLIAAGFSGTFLGVSDSRTDTSRTHFAQMWNGTDTTRRDKNRTRVGLFSFHNYDNAVDATLSGVATDIATYSKPSGMLEHIGADYTELHRLITLAKISAFQQYTLAFNPGSDNGAQYYRNQATAPYYTIGSRTKILRQYIRYIWPNAVRKAATSTDSNVDAVAVLNPNGRYAVVVKALASGVIVVSGLPAGTYGIKYSTGSAYDQDLTDQTITTGGSVATSIPAAGALTIYDKGLISGTLTQTLGALGVHSSVGVRVNGTLAQTLLPLTSTGSAGVGGRTGTLTKTLGAATLTATGVVASSPSALGALNKTLGALTGSAAAQVLVQAALTQTLGALTTINNASITGLGLTLPARSHSLTLKART